jgi:hypothetical protein
MVSAWPVPRHRVRTNIIKTRLSFQQFKLLSIIENIGYAALEAWKTGVPLAQTQLWIKQLLKRK